MTKKLLIVLLLIGCGGDSGGDDDELVVNRPPSSSECDGSVVFTEVSDAVTEPEVPEDSDDVSVEPEGCELSPICRVVRLAEGQGLKVVGLEKVEGAVIVATCGSTVNIGGDGNNNSVPVPVE